MFKLSEDACDVFEPAEDVCDRDITALKAQKAIRMRPENLQSYPLYSRDLYYRDLVHREASCNSNFVSS